MSASASLRGGGDLLLFAFLCFPKWACLTVMTGKTKTSRRRVIARLHLLTEHFNKLKVSGTYALLERTGKSGRVMDGLRRMVLEER